MEKVQSRAVWHVWQQMAHPPHGRVPRFWDLCRVSVFLSFAHHAYLDMLFPHSIGLVLAFTIPRVPGFAINGSTPLTQASGWFNQSIAAQFSRAPANFTFPAAISLQVDTTSNFLPLVFNSLDAQVYDLDSFRLVGQGHMNHTKLPAHKFSDIVMPLNFTYVATNDSDLTC